MHCCEARYGILGCTDGVRMFKSNISVVCDVKHTRAWYMFKRSKTMSKQGTVESFDKSRAELVLEPIWIDQKKFIWEAEKSLKWSKKGYTPYQRCHLLLDLHRDCEYEKC